MNTLIAWILSHIPTRDIVQTLSEREGVQEIVILPEMMYDVHRWVKGDVLSMEHDGDMGPARILVVID